jgi:hypothetical protein
MAHWLDRLAIAATEAEDRRISRRDALRSGGRLAGAAIVATVAGVVAPAASAAGNSYCLAACLEVADSFFNSLIAACKENYLKSFGHPADAVNMVNCVAKTHVALKLALARCRKPFCGSKRIYPPHHGPVPVPKHVPPPKPPPRPPAGGHRPAGPCDSGLGCGPGVCCDHAQLCCTTDNFGQIVQFCVPRNNPGACHGALTGPV